MKDTLITLGITIAPIVAGVVGIVWAADYKDREIAAIPVHVDRKTLDATTTRIYDPEYGVACYRYYGGSVSCVKVRDER